MEYASWLAVGLTLIVASVLLLVVGAVIGRLFWPHSLRAGHSASRILAERYARGEIDHEEYVERARNLHRRWK